MTNVANPEVSKEKLREAYYDERIRLALYYCSLVWSGCGEAAGSKAAVFLKSLSLRAICFF